MIEGRRGIGAASLIGAALAIALSSVLARRAFQLGATPASVLVVRFSVGGVAFAIWLGTSYLRRGPVVRASRNDFAVAAAYGVLLFLANFFELNAIKRAPVALVILMIALAPLWVGLSLRVLTGVPLRPRQAIATILAIGGTAIIVGFPSGNLSGAGIALAVVAGFVGAHVFVLLERKGCGPAAVVILAVGASVASVAAAALEPSALWREMTHGVERAMIVLGVGVAYTCAMPLVLFGIRHAGAFVGGVSTTCEPIFAGCLAWWIIGESLAKYQILGAAVVLLGVVTALVGAARAGRPVRLKGFP